jgi:hypothetical protein
LAAAYAAVKQGLRGKREVLDIVALADGLPLGGKAGDADENGLCRKREKRGVHGVSLFVLYKITPRLV